jgi:hypothetical protein
LIGKILPLSLSLDGSCSKLETSTGFNQRHSFIVSGGSLE